MPAAKGKRITRTTVSRKKASPKSRKFVTKPANRTRLAARRPKKAKPAAKSVKATSKSKALAKRASKLRVAPAAKVTSRPLKTKKKPARAPAKTSARATEKSKAFKPQGQQTSPAKAPVSKPLSPQAVPGARLTPMAAAKGVGRAAVKPAKPLRKGRSRVVDSSAPLAAWIQSHEKRARPTSFIPAPHRAESPNSVAAPPATSDRIVRPDDLTGVGMTIRTLPVRVDIEQSIGRTRISINPEFQQIHSGDGIEWDFRYLGGADVIVEEVVIEFNKPSPFTKATFRSKKPGSARPHRQLSGPASPLAGRSTYTIRCFNIAKYEVAKAQLSLAITPDSE